jgi:hypothetical protein
MIKATHKQNQLREQILQLEAQIFQLLQSCAQSEENLNIINQLRKLKQEMEVEILKLEENRIRQRRFREKLKKKLSASNLDGFGEECQPQRLNDVLFKVVVCSEKEFESFLIHHNQVMSQNPEALGKLLHLRSIFARKVKFVDQADATAFIRSSLDKLVELLNINYL